MLVPSSEIMLNVSVFLIEKFLAVIKNIPNARRMLVVLLPIVVPMMNWE